MRFVFAVKTLSTPSVQGLGRFPTGFGRDSQPCFPLLNHVLAEDARAVMIGEFSLGSSMCFVLVANGVLFHDASVRQALVTRAFRHG
jgi:hypothetical protein